MVSVSSLAAAAGLSGALLLALPAAAGDAVVVYVDAALYPARIAALNYTASLDGEPARPQRLEPGHPVSIRGWTVALKPGRPAEYVLAKQHNVRQRWQVQVPAACTATSGGAPTGCRLILARRAGVPDCALLIGKASGPGGQERLVIECPESVELAPRDG
ncbi:MAG: hypothetical protein U1E23_11520 [Reyranellaceae bacterium]